jgi:hypothetical protein
LAPTVSAPASRSAGNRRDGFDPVAPATFSDGVAAAESIFNVGEGYLTNGATDFSTGDYGEAALLDLFGADYVSAVPLEELLLGAAASL